MNKFFYICALIILLAVKLQAQEYNISRVDESSFPDISFHLEIAGGNDKTVENFVIEELASPVEYTAKITETDIPSGPRTYVFLIENSFYFYKNQIYDEIFSTIQQICRSAQPLDRINIIIFGGNTQIPVKYLSTDPTANTALLAKMSSYYLKPETDSLNFDNPLFPSIEEAVNYIDNNSGHYNANFLTIISRGLNLCSTIAFSKDFFDKVANSDIYINAVMLQTESPNARRNLSELCNITGGRLYTFKKGELEPTIMQLVEKLGKTPPKVSLHCYNITFHTHQNGTNNFVQTRLGSIEKTIEFSDPGKTSILLRHPSTAVALIMFVVLVVVIIIYAIARNKVIKKIDEATMQKMREIQVQNKRLKREIEKYRKHPVSVIHSFDDFNSGENLMAGGQQTPKLVIDNDGERKAFDLNKLVMSLGRAQDNDIVIPNRTVSSHHAVLSFEGGVFFISDQDSTNGVFVNDIRINKSKVHNDDIIRIGAVFAKLKY